MNAPLTTGELRRADDAPVSVPAPEPLLQRVFTPIQLNQLRLPNRILMGSIHLNMDELGDQYARKAAFYAERARHGVALIVTAGCSPNQAGNTSADGFCLDRDALIESHRLITTAVHRAGGRIALQLLHFGREAFHGKLVSASAVRLEANLFTPHALTHSEIEQTIADYAAAAQRAVAAGYDAIELIFSQGFLVHQFLAPKTNRRTDQWGGSFENRMRIAIQIAQRVRAAVGDSFPLLFRIPCLDLLQDGLQPHETIGLIEALLPSGIDLLNVSIGWHESDVPTIAMVVPRAAYSPVAAFIKRRFPQLHVCVSNRINDPRTAERLLASGVADMVSMARPFLADAQLVSKARANRFDAINTCIACNQSCLDYVFTGHPVGCSVNPECGDAREGALPPLAAARRVLVVGGGLAGMCAALYLARRGAAVTLLERDRTLGGQLRMASRIPKKSEFAETVHYYSAALIEHGVQVRCGTPADESLLRGGGWDHVFIATGSTPHVPESLPLADGVQVLTYEQVLLHALPAAYPVAVIGGGGVACDVAKYLAAQWRNASDETQRFLQRAQQRLPAESFAEPYGALLDSGNNDNSSGAAAPVTIVQRSTRKTAHRLGRTTRWIVMAELEQAGIGVLRGVDIEQIDRNGVLLKHRTSGRRETIAAASVVLATGQTVQRDVADLCAQLGLPHTCVGAMAVADSGNVSITSATVTAYRAALALT